MEDGGWRMEDGGWRMEDGGWGMEDGAVPSILHPPSSIFLFLLCLPMPLWLIEAAVSGKFQDHNHSGHETGPDARTLEHGTSMWGYALFAGSVGVLLLLNGLGIL